jgi:hypothetical protein
MAAAGRVIDRTTGVVSVARQTAAPKTPAPRKVHRSVGGVVVGVIVLVVLVATTFLLRRRGRRRFVRDDPDEPR